MSAKPWFAWYPSDYRAKTAHLTYVESEAYRRLLEFYYERRGPLPVGTSLYRLCGAQDDAERHALDRVSREFFTEREGMLHHSRCDAEIAKAQASHERWVEAGRKGGLSSAQGRLEQGIKGGSSNPQPQPHITTTSIKPKNKANGAEAPFLLPEGIDPSIWSDFIDMRKKLRKAPTVRAMWLITGKLFNLERDGHPIGKVLQQSIRNGWQDVFPLRSEK